MTSYQGRKNFTVRTTGTPNYGGVSIIEALNIAEIAGFQPPAVSPSGCVPCSPGL